MPEKCVAVGREFFFRKGRPIMRYKQYPHTKFAVNFSMGLKKLTVRKAFYVADNLSYLYFPYPFYLFFSLTIFALNKLLRNDKLFVFIQNSISGYSVLFSHQFPT